MSDYQKRTPERLVEILRSNVQNPRSWQQEAADEIEGLRLWQRARLEIHDMLDAEIASLRAQLEGCKEMFAHTADRANEYVKAFQQQECKLESARKALEEINRRCSHFEMTMTLPGVKELKAIWYTARDALTDEKSI